MSKPTFKVSLTFEGVTAENPLEAAKQIVKWLQDQEGGAENMTYDVINEVSKEAFTVDLAEEDEDAVLPNDGIEELKAIHEGIRDVLINNGCEEYGDVIIDGISEAVGIRPTTVYYEED